METLFANCMQTVSENLFVNFFKTVCKLFPNSFQTICKLFEKKIKTMFPVHTSVVVMPAISVDFATAASVFYLALLLKSRKGKKKRKTWVRKFLDKGSVHGKLLLEDLRLDGSGFINFLRMSTSEFEILLRMVAPKMSRRNTKYRKAFTPDIRLAITLRYLAS